MEINNSFTSASSIYQQIALKKDQLSSIEKKDIEKSAFEKNDSIILGEKNYDENDYSRVLNKFKNRDSQVKQHEQIHASKADSSTPISYSYQTGPDGKLYAMGGSVRVDTSMPSNPKEASLKLDKLKDAGSSVGETNGADSSISQTANLNKMLILSISEGFNNEN